ncbi:Gfo/Idh/MocA family protein [Sporosarcina newyorkensis]|uniref:Predicted dehydrogenase n=1 Tax=Sporosarcina newyorkensis TaxID=759851 RepID=A0A1T4YLN3_9BACL|nr:Gfo/Idh/MocA family oxidoreductase [Sporosarcina newyorkensis]SKB02610.1 Predicted dehydrogenase [Sporosarcina newyorkensis]
MNNCVRWGILSTARIAQEELIPAFLEADNAVVTAIASSNKQVSSIAEKFGIQKVYSDYDSLLDDKEIDAVYIPLPNTLHRVWVEKAAEKGKHILCEKPAALTKKEAEGMITFCNERNVIFLEAFMYQFHPQHDRVKEIIASGEIGKVKLIRASFSFLLEGVENDIRTQRSLGGGSLYDVGCYCLHSIANITGSKIEEVFVSARVDPKYQVDMSVQGIAKLENGIKAVFDASLEQVRRQQYEIVGTKGTIAVPRAYAPQLFDDEGLVIVGTAKGEVRQESIVGKQYKLQIEKISEWILSDEDQDAEKHYAQKTINNIQAIEACFKSIEKGEFVKVESAKVTAE